MNLDISKLTQMFLLVVKKLKELDLKVSGKMILAAALLLKVKSDKFLGEDLSDFDRLLEEPEEDNIFDDDEDYNSYAMRVHYEKNKRPLIPRTPQPRKRKVSIYDLVDALDKALTVKKRRKLREISYEEIKLPEKQINVSSLIENVYEHIKKHLEVKNRSKLNFKQLVPSGTKEDTIYTFIPLLHLSQLRRVELEQFEAFSDIYITLTGNRNEIKTEEIETL